MSLKVIVNADDFGLTEGVNNSILACHRAGAVTSTTLMVNMPAAQHAARLAQQSPALGVGLHFNLTVGRPLAGSGVASLVRADGDFFRRSELARRALVGKLRGEDVKCELLAQLQKMKDLGLQPTHFDSHQHVHVIPQVFHVLSQVAVQEGVPVRLPWRWPGHVTGKTLNRRTSELLMQVMTWRCSWVKPAAVRSNDGLCSVFDLGVKPEKLSSESYARLLDAYKGGFVELMVHPATVDEELKGWTAITDVSAVEDRLLRTGFLRDYVKSRQGSLVSYRDLT